MKKLVLILMLACAACAGVFAQQSIYVSANGNDDNDGLSEARPLKDLFVAVLLAFSNDINRITVIGTLDLRSEGLVDSWDSVFNFMYLGSDELLITGKQGATGTERAVLSGRGSGKAVVNITTGKIRFQNIEIFGGEGSLENTRGYGLYISPNGSVTLGQGAVIRNNASGGVLLMGTCIIDGGEILENSNPGIFIGGNLTMRSGSIRNNRSSGNAGGVGIIDGGRFTMSGGTISGNAANQAGGGVYVASGGRFDQTGGTISGNTARQGSNPNVYRVQGALGSNLTPGSGSQASSGSSSSAGSSTSSGSSSGGGSNWYDDTSRGVIFLDFSLLFGTENIEKKVYSNLDQYFFKSFSAKYTLLEAGIGANSRYVTTRAFGSFGILRDESSGNSRYENKSFKIGAELGFRVVNGDFFDLIIPVGVSYNWTTYTTRPGYPLSISYNYFDAEYAINYLNIGFGLYGELKLGKFGLGFPITINVPLLKEYKSTSTLRDGTWPSGMGNGSVAEHIFDEISIFKMSWGFTLRYYF